MTINRRNKQRTRKIANQLGVKYATLANLNSKVVSYITTPYSINNDLDLLEIWDNISPSISDCEKYVFMIQNNLDTHVITVDADLFIVAKLHELYESRSKIKNAKITNNFNRIAIHVTYDSTIDYCNSVYSIDSLLLLNMIDKSSELEKLNMIVKVDQK